MRLSTIIELLLIFLIIAFGAYGRVIEPRKVNGPGLKAAIVNTGAGAKRKTGGTSSAALVPATLKQATDSVNKYCRCNEQLCNCCRSLELPFFKLPGNGCASLQYLRNETLAMQLSVGDNILSSTVVTGKSPKPVCVALPGGFSDFCAKVYSIKRDNDDKHFKACLGLELRSSTELEASIRVSCFRFGPDGLRLRPAEPLPTTLTEPTPTSDDDYGDLFGLGDDDDEEEDDEDDEDDDGQKQTDSGNAVAGSSTDEQQEQAEEDDDDDDPLGLTAFLEILTGGDEAPPKKKTKSSVTTTTQAPVTYTIPILAIATSSSPATKKPAVTRKPATTATPTRTSVEAVSSTQSAEINQKDSSETEDEAESDLESQASEDTETDEEDGEATTKAIDEDENEENHDETTAATEAIITEVDEETAPTNRVAPPSKAPSTIKSPEKVKVKKVRAPLRKKVSLTSQSANAIKNDGIKPQHQHQNEEDDDDDDQEEYGLIDSDAEDDDEDEEDDDSKEGTAAATHSVNHANNDKYEGNKDETDYEDDDDDEEEEEEDAVISALVGADEEDDKEGSSSEKTKKKTDKVTDNKTAEAHEDDADYGYELAELLARKQHPERTVSSTRSARQSKVMRL